MIWSKTLVLDFVDVFVKTFKNFV